MGLTLEIWHQPVSKGEVPVSEAANYKGAGKAQANPTGLARSAGRWVSLVLWPAGEPLSLQAANHEKKMFSLQLGVFRHWGPMPGVRKQNLKMRPRPDESLAVPELCMFECYEVPGRSKTRTNCLPPAFWVPGLSRSYEYNGCVCVSADIVV